MKIMHIVTRSDLGGAQSVVLNLANYLCQQHEIIVVAGNGDGKIWTLFDGRIKQERVPYLGRKLSPWKDFLTLLHFIKIYIKYKPDIVHLHSSKVGILGRLVFPRWKIVYTVHGFDSIRLAYRKFLPLERYLQRQCKAVVGVCKYDEDSLRKENIKRNVTYVYNGIYPVDTLSSICLPEGCRMYQKVVLCIARISKQKRFKTFVEVADLLPQYAFVWIGNQEDVEMPGHPNVFCLGNIPDAGRYCYVADLFFLPTNYEGLPVVILEAMSLGKPIVASNVGGISEIVIDDWNGYAVNNVSKLFADKIKFILENRLVYSEFAKHSQQLFYERLTVAKMVEGYMKIYNT